jgi:hypothetical protein
VTITGVRSAAVQALAELPQPIHDALEHVVLRVVDDPPPQVPSDVKAIFLGVQQVSGPDEADSDDEDGDAGPHYDLGDDGELEVVAVGGGALADGEIVLVAGNLADPDDVETALYHEISHALGLDEAGAEELGLG